jgi:uncharacterized protein DUF4231
MTDNTLTPTTSAYASWTSALYVEKRVDQYIAWYDKKAVSTKADYFRMRTAIVLGGVIVPVLANTALPGKDVAVSVLSLIVAAFVALEGVYHYREQWQNYRSTEQFLNREKTLFLTGEGSYKDANSAKDAFVHFVERCESAIETENTATLNVMTLAQQDARPSTK